MQKMQLHFCKVCGKEVIEKGKHYHNECLKECYCIICNKFIGKFTKSVEKKVCSKECKNKLTGLKKSGKNNPRYVDGRCSKEHFCKRCGKKTAGRSKNELCGSCAKAKLRTGIKHTKKSKKLIGEKSRAKFTPEFKIKLRKIMEGAGRWIPLEDLDSYRLYYRQTNWIGDVIKFCSKDELYLLKENGMFCTIGKNKNLNGCVRDHKYSRPSGFKNRVFPELMRHPENLAVITNVDNRIKSRKKNMADSISLEELLNNIIDFSEEWIEQDICIKLAKDYIKGKRLDI